jgi:hypothetical protein
VDLAIAQIKDLLNIMIVDRDIQFVETNALTDPSFDTNIREEFMRVFD